MNNAIDRNAEEKARFEELATAARRKVVGKIAKCKRLIKNLGGDLEKHGDPAVWKRYGDLILANIHNAKRSGDIISVTDYFDENVPVIEIEGEKNASLNAVAEDYFRRYTKARNGLIVIGKRIADAEDEIENANEKLRLINTAIETGD